MPRSRIGDDPASVGAAPRAASHDMILAAAIRCFLTLGYAATSMEEVAREAGVVRSTVFHQVAGKEALFRAVVAHVWQTLPVIDFAEDSPAFLDPVAGLTRFGNAIASFWEPPFAVALLKMIITEEKRFPDLARSFLETDVTPATAALIDYLGTLRRIGAVVDMPDPELAARQFMGLINESLLWPRLVGTGSATTGQPERDRVISEAVATFLSRYGNRDD